MFDYENFFNNDKKGMLLNSFENILNPFEMNFKDDDDSLEALIWKKEKEISEIFKPVQNHAKDLSMNEYVPLKNDLRYDDDDMDKEFKGFEMELDEDKNQLNEINEDIPKIGLNDDLPREEKIFEITKVKKIIKGFLNIQELMIAKSSVELKLISGISQPLIT